MIFYAYGGIAIGLIYLSLFLLIRLLQNRFLFTTSKTYQATPRDFDFDYEDIWFPVTTSTGKVEQIHGWWLPHPQAEERVMLYFHGPYQNSSISFDELNRYRINAFRQAGFSILIFDYRGSGFSEGKFPTEAQLYEDAQAGWDYLTQQRHISPDRLFIYGLSFGGALVIELAIHHPEAAGLIVECSFTSIMAMIRYRRQLWMFPLRWLVTERFESLAKVSFLKLPVLYIHGTEDTVIPPEMSQQLFAASPEPKQLLLVPQAGHWNVGQVRGEHYLQGIQQFVEYKQQCLL